MKLFSAISASTKALSSFFLPSSELAISSSKKGKAFILVLKLDIDSVSGFSHKEKLI